VTWPQPSASWASQAAVRDLAAAAEVERGELATALGTPKPPTWTKYALEQQPKPHYKIAYNFPNSYSINYNLVWQKLLNFSGPFPWKEVVAQTEVPYYLSHANKFGSPMDSRHTYVKLDWLSWGATMADADEGFHTMMDPVYAQANVTACRVPLTDLFDTISATCAYGKRAFVARPVMGGVFAKMLAPGPYPF
jgi:hypothetical protein